MKILIAGNEGYLAKKIAKRFSADNDKTYYLGSSEIEANVNLRVFSMNPSNENARQIFRTYRPDTVIFINNAKQDCISDLTQAQVSEHIKDFISLYSLSDEYKVSRFVYISTSYLYSNNKPNEDSDINPSTKFEEVHYVCEQHILNSKSHVFQKSMILRTATMFDEKPDDSKNIVDYLIYNPDKRKNTARNLYEKYELVHSDDIISALVSLKDFKEDDALNIGQGKALFLDALKLLIHNIEQGNNIDSKSIIYEDGLDVEKAKNVYEYEAKKDLLESLSECVVLKRDYKQEKNKRKPIFKAIRDFFDRDFFKSKLFKTILAYLENLILFGVLLIITDFFNKNLSNNFIDLRVAYIALIGLVHGIRQSSFSAILCIIMLLLNYEMNDYGLITVIYDMDVLVSILVFVSVAMIAGYVKDHFMRTNDELTGENLRLKEQLEYTRGMYNESIAVKDSLQFQVLNATDSYGRIFSSVEKLDSLHFDKLKTEIIIVAEEIMRNKSIALYMVGRNTRFSRLLSFSNSLSDMPKSVEIIKTPEFNQVYITKEMYVNRSVTHSDSPIMMAPVVDDGKVIAMLALYDAPLEVLTLSYENLFNITARLVSQAIIRAYTYQEAQEDRWYIGDTSVLSAQSFYEKLLHAQQANENDHASYVLLNVAHNSNQFLMENSDRFIREFDYVGMGKNDEMYILLNNISKVDLSHVMRRLEESGIDTQIVKEAYSL